MMNLDMEIETMTPSVILPLCSKHSDSYKVRTLLDSGSSSSWISKDILEHLDFTSKGKISVKVFHFEGVKAKRFEVVQIYVLGKWHLIVQMSKRGIHFPLLILHIAFIHFSNSLFICNTFH